MKKLVIIAAIAAIAAGCGAPSEMQVKVTPLGEEIAESSDKGIYTLPRTILKVEVSCQEEKNITGPFKDYAEKYLGIQEVIRQNTSKWQIFDLDITSHQEMDPEMVFQVHLLKGSLLSGGLDDLKEKGVIMDGTCLVQEEIRSPALGVSVEEDYIYYKDLGIDSNFEERIETMYKTIITDTSFLEVPVNRTITEQKTLSKKAEEAANFILELRTRRFELLTGEYEGYPQGEAMKSTLEKLDELEASYLSLFTGKTLRRKEKRAWFIVPRAGSASSTYPLGVFSEQLGFVPVELMEGQALELVLEPEGNTKNMDAYFSGKPSEQSNVLYYRIPDLVHLKLMLWKHRIGQSENLYIPVRFPDHSTSIIY